jgi:phosphatidylinositol-3,4,5-trisphosphate 3-phosphatase/dual-specificity protein phosphatase PTEN
MSGVVRSLVSKKKVRSGHDVISFRKQSRTRVPLQIRFVEDGFDLDLTYITPKIIAMGAPSEGSEAAYRNPLSEVHRFFESRHAGRYRLYDLRGEKGVQYDADKFGGQVARFGFFDHNPAPLALILEAVTDIHTWLTAHADNVVAIHCKAGKGRTGLIIAAYLVYAGLAASTSAGLKMFGELRTTNGKGVTIPSQMRCVLVKDTRVRVADE